MDDWRRTIAPYLTVPIRQALQTLPDHSLQGATDLRLRANKPPILMGQAIYPLDVSPPTARDMQAMADAMLGHAAYARQQELRQGFVTLPGGFRAGLCGRAVVREGRLYALQDIASIAIRISREILGAADGLLPHLAANEGLQSVLLVSPPGMGKTTILRDGARQLSEMGYAVAIVDERSEIAACAHGIPTLDVGPHTDVLDGCPKAEGMALVLRAMAPRLIITDEIGRAADGEALLDAARCGVAVLASAHGASFEDIRARPVLQALFSGGAFARIVVLSAMGQIGGVYDGEGMGLV